MLRHPPQSHRWTAALDAERAFLAVDLKDRPSHLGNGVHSDAHTAASLSRRSHGGLYRDFRSYGAHRHRPRVASARCRAAHTLCRTHPPPHRRCPRVRPQAHAPGVRIPLALPQGRVSGDHPLSIPSENVVVANSVATFFYALCFPMRSRRASPAPSAIVCFSVCSTMGGRNV